MEPEGVDRRKDLRRKEDKAVVEAIEHAVHLSSWRDRLAPWALGLGLVLMIAATVISVAVLREINERREAEFEACKAIQNLRNGLNQSNGIIYLVLGTADLNDEKLTKTHREWILLGKNVQYRPPTDCEAATDNPGDYERPKPIRYEEYIKKGGKPPVPLPSHP